MKHKKGEEYTLVLNWNETSQQNIDRILDTRPTKEEVTYIIIFALFDDIKTIDTSTGPIEEWREFTKYSLEREKVRREEEIK